MKSVRRWSASITFLIFGLWAFLLWSKPELVTDFLIRLHPVSLITLLIPIYFFPSVVIVELLPTTIPAIDRWSEKHYPSIVGICWFCCSATGLTMIFIGRSNMAERLVP
jgi:hypothetical protein